MPKNTLRTGLSLTACVLLAACSSAPQNGSMGQTGGRSDLPSLDPKDPVAVSGLREKALTIIQNAGTDQDTHVRTNAIEASDLAPERLSAVIGYGLDDKNPGVRSVAAMAVGKSVLTKLVGRVRPLLNDENAFVRASAIYALARCNAQVDRSPLATILLSDPSFRLRSHAAFILGELGDTSALPLLREAIRDRSSHQTAEQFKLFELQAAEAMIKLGDDSQRTVIRAALYPSAPDQLEATALAVQIIGEVQDREAAAQLVALADYRTPVAPAAPGAPVKQGKPYPAEVRLAVAGALSAMGFRGGGNAIADEFFQNSKSAIRAQTAYVYGQIGGAENWGRLDALMGDQDGIVRVSAAAAVLRCLAKAQGS